MCGIIGNVSPALFAASTREYLLSGLETLKHRGPELTNIFEAPGLTVGFNRLSFVDIANNCQPYCSGSGQFLVCFNGEIYNHSELRKLLRSHGYEPRTRSEVEVLAELCRYYTIEEIVRRINGMFALFIHDTVSSKSYLVRDRFGEKPLYYRFKNNELQFASELRALKSFCNKKISQAGLIAYLQFNAVISPLSLFEEIHKVPSGSIVEFHDQQMKITHYWEPRLTSSRATEHTTFLVDELSERLTSAVERRLSAEVPIGVALSGGLDSSILAAVAASKTNVKTFSIGFNEQSYDEQIYSRKVSRILNTEHHLFNMTYDDLKTASLEILCNIDEPVNDPSITPTFFLFKRSKEYVKALLTGDGADELFMGYRIFELFYFANLATKSHCNKLLKYLNLLISRGYNEENLNAKLICSMFFKILDKTPESAFYEAIGAFNQIDQQQLLAFDPGETNMDVFSSLHSFALSSKESATYLEQMQLSIMCHFLKDQVLNKLDRASMWASMEARCPYLDNEVVDLALRLPQKLKFNHTKTKVILKKIGLQILPKTIVARKKMGFRVPVAKLIRTQMKNEVVELLTGQSVRSQGLFNQKYTEKLVSDHLKMKVDNHKKIWSLLTFQLWYYRNAIP